MPAITLAVFIASVTLLILLLLMILLLLFVPLLNDDDLTFYTSFVAFFPVLAYFLLSLLCVSADCCLCPNF